MLSALGVSSVEELFQDIPQKLRLRRELELPEARSEMEVEAHVLGLLARNKHFPLNRCFLGSGVWAHYVPAAVEAIVSRSEYYTSYTPYQPEVSQGMLQALFEYQSLIADLFGMDYVSSSLYDWASALGEACRMAFRLNRRRTILVSRSCGPERLKALKTYVNPLGVTVKEIDFNRPAGDTSVRRLVSAIDQDTSCIYMENPNFLGVVEPSLADACEAAHSKGALAIMGVDPSSLGVIKPPGEYGADIAVGEGQSLGIPMNYGGPLLGILAVREDRQLLRQMPGRIIGLTTSKDGSRRGFSMVLQTREQHIRREDATSNICTNQALCALAAASYLALLGPVGMQELGKTIISNSHYAAELLGEIGGLVSPAFLGAFFKEFCVRLAPGISPELLHRELAEQGVLGALPLARFFPELQDLCLFAITEVHSKEDIEFLRDCVVSTVSKRV